MSRVGKNPVPVPSGVTAELKANVITVKGPKGQLERTLHPDMIIEVESGEIRVKRPTESKPHKSLHGLTRTLIANMVEGVTKGYERRLEIVGVGYIAAVQGDTLQLMLLKIPYRYESPKSDSDYNSGYSVMIVGYHHATAAFPTQLTAYQSLLKQIHFKKRQ